MAIDLATGFNIGSKDAIDERQVLTLEQMKNLDESIYPDKYFAICKDDGKLYIFNASNEINAETGKFRVLSGGTGGGDTTYVLPPATDTTLGGVKVDNVTITVDSEGVITAINSYTKTEVDDLLNNKLDRPAVDGTAGQILVLQDDGSLAYEDNVGSGNVEAMADLILDTEVRIDKTYSSSKIYSDIQQCLEDSKTYTLQQLEKVKIDDTLTTTDKTIVGAINEVKLSIPTRTSELENNSNFITNDDLPTVPTKVSDLENDRGYLISIPEEYITETELEAKGYLTSHQDISNLQSKIDNNLATTSKEVVGAINEVKSSVDGITVPTKTSDLTNDSGFITSIPSEYITETELETKGYLTEHQSLTDYAKKTDIPDVSDFLTEVPTEYVTDTKLSTVLDKKVNKEVVIFETSVCNVSIFVLLSVIALFIAEASFSCPAIQSDISLSVLKSSGASATTFAISVVTVLLTCSAV